MSPYVRDIHGRPFGYAGYVKDGRVVITEPKYQGILRDWQDWDAEETLVDLVAVEAPKPPRFPWEIPAAVVLIVAGLALLLL